MIVIEKPATAIIYGAKYINVYILVLNSSSLIWFNFFFIRRKYKARLKNSRGYKTLYSWYSIFDWNFDTDCQFKQY